jgi:hypothetical protein
VPFEFEVAIEKLKRQITRFFDQISAEMIKAGDRTICYGIHELIVST